MADLKTYKFKVEMTCEGCVNAVKKCSQKAFGDRLKSVDTDLTTKEVILVIDNTEQQFTYDDVFKVLEKTGKEVQKVE